MRDKDMHVQKQKEPQNAWEEFGLTRPRYEEERDAPPVDRELLRALVERRLPVEERREVYRLTLRFRSWAEALAELDIETLKREMGGPEGSIRLWDGGHE